MKPPEHMSDAVICQQYPSLIPEPLEPTRDYFAEAIANITAVAREQHSIGFRRSMRRCDYCGKRKVGPQFYRLANGEYVKTLWCGESYLGV